MHSVSGIYRIRNTVNGRLYVGSSVNVDSRWIEHKLLLNKSSHPCRPLQSAWIKYGEAAFVFEIIETIEGRDSLMDHEQVYLDDAFAGGPPYNVCRKAYSCFGVKRSAETRAKLSAAQLKRADRQIELNGQRAPISEWARTLGMNLDSLRGRLTRGWPVERALTEPLQKSGRKHTAETRTKQSAAKRGRKQSPEHIAKRAAWQRGRKLSPEHVAKRVLSRRNGTSTRLVELNGKLASISEWARMLGISRSTLRKRLRSGWTLARALSDPGDPVKRAAGLRYRLARWPLARALTEPPNRRKDRRHAPPGFGGGAEGGLIRVQ